jgi:hypothetical protein
LSGGKSTFVEHLRRAATRNPLGTGVLHVIDVPSSSFGFTAPKPPAHPAL